MGDAARFFGGVLTGTGQGLLEKAKADRRETLARIRQEGADSRLKSSQEHSSGMIRSVASDTSGKTYGITAGGDVKDLQIQQAVAGLSIDDKRELDAAIKRETTGKGSFEGEKTDWDAVAKRLRDVGREDLASRVQSMDDEGGSTKVDSPEYREALRVAEKEAQDKNPIGPDAIRPGGMKKAYGGLSEQEWITQRASELYDQYKGGGKPASRGAAGSAKQYSSKEDVKKAYDSGELTRDQAGKILREQFGYE